MSAQIVREAIVKNTQQFLTELPELKLRDLLMKDVSRQFANNFSDIGQMKLTFMYLPLKSLRGVVKDDSLSDEEMLIKIQDNFYDYTDALSDAILNLTPEDRELYLMVVPHDVLIKVISMADGFTMEKMKAVLLALDDETLLKYGGGDVAPVSVAPVSEGYYYADDLTWCGIR
jgi:hypothetical protein